MINVRLESRAEKSQWFAYLSPVLAALLTLTVGMILFAALGKPPLEVLYTFFVSPISDLYGLGELAVKATPILLCAMGLALCYRANVWNIGAEGQLLMGGLMGSWAALQFLETQAFWVLPVVLIAGVMGGMAWAAIPAVLKTQFNTNVILTTIMLNYIALNLLLFAVHGPLKDPNGFNFPESALFPDWILLPILFDGSRVHLGLLLGLLFTGIVWVLLSKTFIGFQMSVLGKSPQAAHFAGFKQKHLIWFVLLSSGGLAGLAGVLEVTGPIGQLIPHISPGYGYAAIIVAYLGRLHPLGILLASFLMALLYLGGEMAQIELGLPLALTSLFQGMLLLFLISCDVLINFRLRIERS